MAVIDELLVALGYDYNDKGVQQFSKDIGETIGLVKSLVKWAAAGATAITGLTVATTKAADEQGKLAAELGINVSELDALQFAAQRSGGSAEGMARGLQELAKRAAEASRGVGSGVEAFGLLGINVHDANGNLKSTSQLFREVSSRIQGLSKGRQLDLLDKLGLSDSVRLLQAGAGEIQNLTEEARALGVTTAEDAEIAAEFQDSLTDIWRVVKQLSRILVRTFAPVLKDINLRMTAWWKTNRAFLEQNIPLYIERITFALKLLSIGLAALIALKFIQHGIVLVKLFRAMGVAGLLAAAGPVALAVALTALALIIEDIYGWTQGKDSLFGQMLEEVPLLKTAVEGIAAAFQTIGRWIGKSIEGWKLLVEAASRVPGVGRLWENTKEFLSKADFSGDRMEQLGVKRDFSFSGQAATATGTTVGNMVINVNGAGDPAAVAREVERRMLLQASEELNGPVDQ